MSNKNWYHQIDLNSIDELDEIPKMDTFEKTKKKSHFDDGTTSKNNRKKKSKNRKTNANKTIQ